MHKKRNCQFVNQIIHEYKKIDVIYLNKTRKNVIFIHNKNLVQLIVCLMTSQQNRYFLILPSSKYYFIQALFFLKL